MRDKIKLYLALIVGRSTAEIEAAVPMEPAKGVDGVDPPAHLPHVETPAARDFKIVHGHFVLSAVMK